MHINVNVLQFSRDFICSISDATIIWFRQWIKRMPTSSRELSIPTCSLNETVDFHFVVEIYFHLEIFWKCNLSLQATQVEFEYWFSSLARRQRRQGACSSFSGHLNNSPAETHVWGIDNFRFSSIDFELAVDLLSSDKVRPTRADWCFGMNFNFWWSSSKWFESILSSSSTLFDTWCRIL